MESIYLMKIYLTLMKNLFMSLLENTIQKFLLMKTLPTIKYHLNQLDGEDISDITIYMTATTTIKFVMVAFFVW